MSVPVVQRVVAVLWPSFLVAGAATILFFATFDPHDLMDSIGVAYVSRMTVYSVGFFVIWMIALLSSLLTVYFMRPVDSPRRKP